MGTGKGGSRPRGARYQGLAGEGEYWRNCKSNWLKWDMWSLGYGCRSGVTGNEASEVGGSQVLWVLKATGRAWTFHPESCGATGACSAGERHGAICFRHLTLLLGGEWVGGEDGVQHG